MSGLKALKKLMLDKELVNTEEFVAIEKDLEVLQILKDKSVNLDHLKHSKDYDEYNALCEYYVSISGEEYDLLKEVFDK